MIKLELTVEETNCILNALAYQPYKDVAELIVKIQNVGNEQIGQHEFSEETSVEN